MPVAHFAANFRQSRKGSFDGQFYGRSEKRKRHVGFSEQSDPPHSPPLDPRPSATGLLSQSAAEQYRTAGQPSEDEAYPYPFPHAALEGHAAARSPSLHSEPTVHSTPESRSHMATGSDNKVLEETTAPSSSLNSGLRQQHYNVLTSLLHRCILERDYVRASRAWGMLLRMEIHGHPFDIRVQERWGVGAELLLHGGNNSDNELTLQNLTKATEYYERLILQYPYRKAAPNMTSSLDFYPAMFGICIYSIQLRYNLATQTSLQGSKSKEGSVSNEQSDSDNEDARFGTTGTRTDSGNLACQVAVQQARVIVERLSELLISPPFSDHPGLWWIQGMLYVWISQLLDHTAAFLQQPSNSGDNSTSSSSASQSSDSNTETTVSVNRKKTSRNEHEERQEAINKAKEAFSRARDLGDIIHTPILQEMGLWTHILA